MMWSQHIYYTHYLLYNCNFKSESKISERLTSSLVKRIKERFIRFLIST